MRIQYFNEHTEPFDKEETKKFFLDKIDWNLINKIQYALTKFEDNGGEWKIKIMLNHIDKPSRLSVICTIVNGLPHYVSDYNHLIETYNKNPKIFYQIDLEDISYNDYLYDRIVRKAMCNSPDYDYDGYYISKNNI